jgi:hypothetical protein
MSRQHGSLLRDLVDTGPSQIQHRVMPDWHQLPALVVEASSLAISTSDTSSGFS